MDPYETDEDPDYEPEDESEGDDDSKIQDEESRKTVKSKKRVRNEMEWQDKKEKDFAILVRNTSDIKKRFTLLVL